MTAVFLLLQVVGPNDCVLSGLCGVAPQVFGPPSGVMFAALGLVAFGVLGLRAIRKP
jgi:tetrahydromethanopterin S-methyltransferase subunit C